MFQKQNPKVGEYYELEFDYECTQDGMFSGSTQLTEFEDFFPDARYCMFIRSGRLTSTDVVFDVVALDTLGRACLLTKKYPLSASFCDQQDIVMDEMLPSGISDIRFNWSANATVEAIELGLAKDLGDLFYIRLGVVEGVTPSVVWNEWFPRSRKVAKQVIAIDEEPDLIVID